MPRENPRHLRARIAQLAAQLMAEHGIRDHSLAKRKAARQLGVESASILPGNDEIDDALKSYMTLFESEDYEQDLDAMRRQAIEVMEMLARFQPVLTGGLVEGVASRHSDIELEVYSDSSKEFEQFLLNRDIPFKTEERRGGSFFTLYSDPADVVVRVLPEQLGQNSQRASGGARQRMTVEQLRQLLSEQTTPGLLK